MLFSDQTLPSFISFSCFYYLFRLFRDQTVPLDLLKSFLPDGTGKRPYFRLPVSHRPKPVRHQPQGKRMIVLFKLFLLYDPVLPLKRVKKVEYDRAVEIINEKRQKDLDNIIRTFEQDPDLRVLNGRFGPYIAYKKNNYKSAKSVDPATLTYEQCMAIVEDPKNAPKKKTAKKK